MADTNTLRTAAQAVVDVFAKFHWPSSLKVAELREPVTALAAALAQPEPAPTPAAKVQGVRAGSLRISSWPTGPEFHFEPLREVLNFPPGTYELRAFYPSEPAQAVAVAKKQCEHGARSEAMCSICSRR